MTIDVLKSTTVCEGQSDVEQALRLQNARLAALQQVALSLTSTLNLPEVLERVVEMAQTLSASAHSHIFLYDPGQDELTLAASRWSADQRRLPLQPRRHGVTATVAQTGQPQFISDTAELKAYADVPAELKPGALACLPLIKEGHVLGTLNLGYWEPHPFDAETRNFLDLLARHAALAIDNARLHALAVEKARLEHELEMARTVQSSLMPRSTPHARGWEYAAFWQPAHIVGGDMYDFVSLPRSKGKTRQGISIADVADKGMPAALFMALTRATLRTSITVAGCPGDCIAHANRLLCQDATDGMFVTMCHAQIETSTGNLVYVNAGHNRPLWYRKTKNQLLELESTGIALGIDIKHKFQERTIFLEPGDFLLFFTDGITDAGSESGQEFGKARLKQLLIDLRCAPARGIVAALEETLRRFVGAAPQFDDMTAVVVKRAETAKST